MDKDILIVKINMFLRDKEINTIRNYILTQRDTGLIILPPYCEPVLVPKDVEIQFEEEKEKK